MALADIDPYPWFLNKAVDLVVNEQMVHTRISATEWADHWRPFLGHLYDLWTKAMPKRYIIALAGLPAAGKSVLAEQLHWIIDKGFFHKEAHSVALPMDGFHFPNSYLKTHYRTLGDGVDISLYAVKGQPDTIDVPRLKRYVQMLIARPEHVSWPGYSRFTHDVVPDKFVVHESANIIFVEGNYLLVNRGPFEGLPELFDLRVYVDAPGPKVITNLVERHIKGGKEIEEAKDWVKRIDLPNARVAESTRGAADVIVERDTDDEISTITWKGNEALTTRTSNSPTDTEEPATPLPPRPMPHAPVAPQVPPHN